MTQSEVPPSGTIRRDLLKRGAVVECARRRPPS